MTVASQLNRVTYTGNGSTTAFAVSFPFQSTTDLVVIETIIATGVQTTKTLTTHYTVTGTPDSLGFYSNGGTVNAVTAPASTVRWTIYRDPPKLQSLNLAETNALPAESLEAQLDYLTMLVQRVSDLIGRSARQPDGDSSNIGALPSSVDRASKFLAFDGNGDPVAAAGTSANLTPVSTFINTLLDDADASTARTTLGAASSTDILVVDSLKQAVTNPIINGNMEIWQRGTSFVSPSTATYTADRWGVLKVGGGDFTVRQSTNVPTVAQAGVLFNYSLEVDVTTLDTTSGATDSYAVYQKIEGYNWRHFAQRAFVLSFWVMSSKTGTHTVGLLNSGQNRCYPATYTISAADTWEFKTLTIAASPSAGTWDYTSGIGLHVIWNLSGIGTNFLGLTPNNWNSNAQYVYNQQVNVMDSASNFFRLTGVKLELGSVATSIQFVPFDEELARCQRYFQKSFLYATAPAQNVGQLTGEALYMAMIASTGTEKSARIPLSPIMRTAPTVTTYNPGAASAEARNETRNENGTSTSTVNPAPNGFMIQNTGTAATVVGDTFGLHWTADAEL